MWNNDSVNTLWTKKKKKLHVQEECICAHYADDKIYISRIEHSSELIKTKVYFWLKLNNSIKRYAN